MNIYEIGCIRPRGNIAQKDCVTNLASVAMSQRGLLAANVLRDVMTADAESDRADSRLGKQSFQLQFFCKQEQKHFSHRSFVDLSGGLLPPQVTVTKPSGHPRSRTGNVCATSL